MLQSKSVLGHTRVVLGPLRLFLSVYDVIRVECLFVYYVVSMCMHFFLITPSPCVRAAPHVTASGEAPRSGSGGSRSLGDLPNHPSPTHLMSDLRGRQTVTTDQTTPTTSTGLSFPSSIKVHENYDSDGATTHGDDGPPQIMRAHAKQFACSVLCSRSVRSYSLCEARDSNFCKASPNGLP